MVYVSYRFGKLYFLLLNFVLMKKNLVSVVVPSFNGERFISQTIKSILEQDYPGLELIIVDDGSSDRSADIVSSFKDSRLRFYINRRNQGIAKTRNIALDKVRGEYVTFFDHDDIMLPKAISKRVEFLKQNQKAQAVFGYTEAVINSHNKVIHKHPFQHEYLLQKTGIDYCRKVKVLDCRVLAYYRSNFRFAFLSNLLIKKELIKKTGVFDTNFFMADDGDYFFRLSLKAPLHFVDIPVKRYRVHGNNRSLTISRQQMWEDGQRLWAKRLCFAP